MLARACSCICIELYAPTPESKLRLSRPKKIREGKTGTKRRTARPGLGPCGRGATYQHYFGVLD
jgi:hypothetical protein